MQYQLTVKVKVGLVLGFGKKILEFNLLIKVVFAPNVIKIESVECNHELKEIGFVMKNITKKLWISLALLNLMIPITAVSVSHPGASARRIHHHQVHRIVRNRSWHRGHHRRHHRKRRHHYRRRNAAERSDQTKSFSSGSFLDQMKHQTFMDINHDCRLYGLDPLRETHELNRLAHVRARQLTVNFSHYDRRGRTYYKQDAEALGINLQHFHDHQSASGENIADANIDHGDDGTYMPTDPKRYQNRNGYDMADMDNDAMFNYDANSNWGHRQNILNRQYCNVGISVVRHAGEYYLSEEFDS